MEKNPHRLVDNELRSYLQHVKGIIDKNEFEDEEGKNRCPINLNRISIFSVRFFFLFFKDL
jgi:hypothetical protein